MLISNPTALLTTSAGALASAKAIQLPTVDVRTRLNEQAFRGWTESTRRIARDLALFATDSLAGILAVWAVQNTWNLVSAGGRRPLPDEIPLIAMVFCLMPLALRVTGAYAGGKARTDVLKIAGGIAVAAFLGWVQARLFGREVPTLPNKAAYVYSFILITAFAWGLRLLLDRLIAAGYKARLLQRRVLVVGTLPEAAELAAQASATDGCELAVVGRLASTSLSATDGSDSGLGTAEVPFCGQVEELEEALSQTGAQGVIVLSSTSLARLEAVVTACFRTGATVSVAPSALKQLKGAQIEVRQSSCGVLLQLSPMRLRVPQLAVKRTMDVLLTAIGLVVLTPLLAIVAVAVKLDSAGPVLFRQVRLGVGGRRFAMLKFRTMVVGADGLKAHLQHLNEYADPKLFKIKNDPRVTRLGRLLRKYSLDELPQLWNVLRGDMSLVGPRPCVPEEFQQYAPHHMERLFVVPGVTGPWQVGGRNEITDFEEVIRLERDYIRSWSVVLDVAILFKTIPALLGRGAY
jgi:exopolysaccharide biosynthesis polyprenyl glycosylphosphotransferase